MATVWLIIQCSPPALVVLYLKAFHIRSIALGKGFAYSSCNNGTCSIGAVLYVGGSTTSTAITTGKNTADITCEWYAPSHITYSMLLVQMQ